MTKIGLTLSGGGVRGIAHLGALEALEKIGVEFSIISGTSAGAIAGALFAAGYLPIEIMAIVKETKLFSIHNQKLWSAGLFGLKPMRNVLKKYIPENSFEALQIPLHVAATDITNAQIHYFSSGELDSAVVASACVPFIFEPIAYQDTLFVDGGVINNLPIEPIISKCDKIVAIHVNNPIKKITSIKKISIAERSLNLIVSNSVYTKTDQCTVLIDPPELEKYKLFNMKNADLLYKAGYEHTLSMEKEILRKLK